MTRVKTESTAAENAGAAQDNQAQTTTKTTEAAATEANASTAKAPKAAPKPKATTAKATPVATTKTTEAAAIDTAAEGEVKFDTGGDKIITDIGDDTTEIEIEQANAGRIAALAFLEEPVTIRIHGTTDDNAEQMIFCQVNGQGAGPNGIPYLPREIAVTIKRKFVEVLARARPVKVKHSERFNPESGERESVLNTKSSLMYPFDVVNDSDKGRAWLSGIINQARA